MNKMPMRAVLLNSIGDKVGDYRTDRMNYDAFTWVVADAKYRHGEIKIEFREIDDAASEDE